MPRIKTLLYVSECTSGFRPDPGIDEIVAWSVPYNRSVGITGALIYSEGLFSQYLEGSEHQVHDLLGRIRADSRHQHLIVTREVWQDRRLFPRWSLAYAGDARFVTQEISRLYRQAEFRAPKAPDDGAQVIEIMHDFLRQRAALGPTMH